MATLGERLRGLIDEMDMTQKQAAEQLGIKPSTIHGYITNDRSPDIEMQKKIADFFNVSVDYLIGHSDKRYSFEKNADPYILDHLDDELNSFINEPANKDFIDIAKILKENGFKVPEIKDLLMVLNSEKLKDYLALLKKIESKGINPKDIGSLRLRVEL